VTRRNGGTTEGDGTSAGHFPHGEYQFSLRGEIGGLKRINKGGIGG